MFRSLRALALLALIPAPALAALARVEVAPSLGASASAPAAASLTALAPAPLTAAFTAPALSAPPAASLAAAAMPPAAVHGAPTALYAPAAPASAPALIGKDGTKYTLTVLDSAAKTAAKAPASLAQVFDAAAKPAAPDYDALKTFRPVEAPAPWRPRASLLKPFAAAVNGMRDAAYRSKMSRLSPDERLTSEEMGLREALGKVHSALSAGRFQDALSLAGAYFHTDRAIAWHQENPRFGGYWSKGQEYVRFTESALLAAYRSADARAGDAALTAEARAAAASGRVLGRGWRPTAIQAKDTGTCAQNALFNAIAASAGFVRPTRLSEFVAASRALLDRGPNAPGARPGEAEALARETGLDLGRRDVSQGMGTSDLKEWARALGLDLRASAPPKSPAAWDALLASGRQNMLALRMFHPRFKLGERERRERGHDLRVLHHEVYLLGAYDSAALGRRLYLVQDSGSGKTLMFTADELTALATETHSFAPAGPVSLPAR